MEGRGVETTVHTLKDAMPSRRLAPALAVSEQAGLFKIIMRLAVAPRGLVVTERVMSRATSAAPQLNLDNRRLVYYDPF